MLQEPPTPPSVQEIYRDASLLIIDKPAGLPVHPSSRYLEGTVVNRLRQQYGEAFAAPVHRLDRETSGVMVCARHRDAARHLSRAFARGAVRKEYWALCEGDARGLWAPEGEVTVDGPIAVGGRVVRIGVRIDRVEGKPASTRFCVERVFRRNGECFSWVRAFPVTGRRHQIRVHLREAGLPLVGDKIYGPDERFYEQFAAESLPPHAWERLRLPRQALHAARIVFPHPESGEFVSFSAPLPADLRAFCGMTRSHSSVDMEGAAP